MKRMVTTKIHQHGEESHITFNDIISFDDDDDCCDYEDAKKFEQDAVEKEPVTGEKRYALAKEAPDSVTPASNAGVGVEQQQQSTAKSNSQHEQKSDLHDSENRGGTCDSSAPINTLVDDICQGVVHIALSPSDDFFSEGSHEKSKAIKGEGCNSSVTFANEEVSDNEQKIMLAGKYDGSSSTSCSALSDEFFPAPGSNNSQVGEAVLPRDNVAVAVTSGAMHSVAGKFVASAPSVHATTDDSWTEISNQDEVVLSGIANDLHAEKWGDTEDRKLPASTTKEIRKSTEKLSECGTQGTKLPFVTGLVAAARKCNNTEEGNQQHHIDREISYLSQLSAMQQEWDNESLATTMTDYTRNNYEISNDDVDVASNNDDSWDAMSRLTEYDLVSLNSCNAYKNNSTTMSQQQQQEQHRPDERSVQSKISGAFSAYSMVDGKISCEKCTFLNQPGSTMCEVCDGILGDLDPSVDIDTQLAMSLQQREDNLASELMAFQMQENGVAEEKLQMMELELATEMKETADVIKDKQEGVAFSGLLGGAQYQTNEILSVTKRRNLAEAGFMHVPKQDMELLAANWLEWRDVNSHGRLPTAETTSWLTWMAFHQTSQRPSQIAKEGIGCKKNAHVRMFTTNPDASFSSGEDIWLCAIILGETKKHFTISGDCSRVDLHSSDQCLPLLRLPSGIDHASTMEVVAAMKQCAFSWTSVANLDLNRLLCRMLTPKKSGQNKRKDVSSYHKRSLNGSFSRFAMLPMQPISEGTFLEGAVSNTSTDQSCLIATGSGISKIVEASQQSWSVSEHWSIGEDASVCARPMRLKISQGRKVKLS